MPHTYTFRSEFQYETPDNTLSIIVTGKMQPGCAATMWEPYEGPEIAGNPEIEITGENDEVINFDDLPEKQQDKILELAVIHHESTDSDSEYDNDDIY